MTIGGDLRDARALVDLRSDAVTRPSPAMWEAMRADPLVWSRGGDPTAAELERRVAEMAGFPAAVLLASGTMANTLALLVSTSPGDALLVDRHAHILRAEGGAYRTLAGLVPVAVETNGGHLDRADVDGAMSEGPRPSLVWLENTHTFAGGTVAGPDQMRPVVGAAKRAGMGVHVDGARLWNAAVASGSDLASLTDGADTVTLNLDKGLGCPFGAVLCGTPPTIRAVRERMVGLGGVLAQQGLLAAAGLAALDGHAERIERDHALARALADGLRAAGAEVDPPDTNIVFVRVSDALRTLERLARRGVLAFARDARTIRFVTHSDVGTEEIERVVAMGSVLCEGETPVVDNPRTP